MSADVESDHEQKRHKKSKRKQRHEEGETADKMDVDEAPEATDSAKKEKKKKKSKDKKRKDRTDDVEAEAEPEAGAEDPAVSPEKKHKRQKSEDKKEKKTKKHKRASPPPPAEQTSPALNQAAVVPEDKQYPFFTQTFSQRVPVWPAAFDEPITKMAREYLDPMLNRYSPKFKGVLLAYKNVNLSDRPRRADPESPPTDDTPVVLESFECYAPPFAWLTADLHLFVPSRGAWMEGVINLQSEGHIGVVCFEKFNASISRRSLPRGWKWVEQEEEEEEVVEEDPFEEQAQDGEEGAEGEAEGEGEEGRSKETQATPRLRSTGYWVDENGDKVEGKIYFRIKNFSSGSTGDYTYLSLQGTMLDDESERRAAAEEQAAEKARRARQNPNGLLYPTMRLPESSMTKLKDVAI